MADTLFSLQRRRPLAASLGTRTISNAPYVDPFGCPGAKPPPTEPEPGPVAPGRRCAARTPPRPGSSTRASEKNHRPHAASGFLARLPAAR